MEFKEGDEIEIVENPSYFWDRVKPGMKGYITHITDAGAMDIIVHLPDYGDCFQHIGSHKWKLIKKINKEKKTSGFGRWIKNHEKV